MVASIVRRPSTPSKDLSAETTRPILSYAVCRRRGRGPGGGGEKVYKFGLGHTLAAMPTYGKTSNNLLLQNH